jgi:hypothetical protein
MGTFGPACASLRYQYDGGPVSIPSIWAYRAQLVRVIDGDTLDVTICQCERTKRLTVASLTRNRRASCL